MLFGSLPASRIVFVAALTLTAVLSAAAGDLAPAISPSSFLDFPRQLEELSRRPAQRVRSFSALVDGHLATPYRFSSHMVSCRDGVRLRTSVYLPSRGERFPLLVLRTPYLGPQREGRDPAAFTAMAEYFCARGYGVVLQSLRGKYGSEGTYELLSRQEIPDATDLLDWLHGQPWSSGRVAVHGVSHDGFTALAAASTNHPSVKLCIAGGAPARLRTDAFVQGGAPLASVLDYIRYQETQEGGPYTQDFAQQLLEKTTGVAEAHRFDRMLYGRDLRLWDELLAALDDPGGEYWKERQLLGALAGSTVPMVHVAGWFPDGDRPDTVRNFEWMQGRPGAGSQRLILGWWGHGGSGPYGDPNRTMQPYLLERYEAYLAGALRGEASPLLDEPPVHLYVQGRGTWRKDAAWPPAGVEERSWYLVPGEAGHHLVPDLPDGAGSVAYRVDPAVAAPAGVQWATAPLEEGIQLMGKVAVDLWVTAETPDADWICLLMRPDAPEGQQGFNLVGVQRGRFRGGADAAARRLVPGEPTRLRIEFGPFGQHVPAGERLVLVVLGKLPQLLVRNTQTGGPHTGPDGFRAGSSRILTGPEYPSRLTLRVIP